MMLRQIFVNAKVHRAHIVDDAYDEAPSFSISSGTAQTFVEALNEELFDRACAVIEMEGADEAAFVEALADPDKVAKLFLARDIFAEESNILFGEFLTTREAKRVQVAPLVELLEGAGVECKTFGVDYPVKSAEEPQLIFIDLRLREDGGPISVDAAVEICEKLREAHQQCHPFVFLMSTLSEPLKRRRDEFRKRAGLFASQFESLEKAYFTDREELTAILSKYARVLPQLRLLQKSIENVGIAVQAATTGIRNELRNLDLADYFVLHRNTVSIEKVGLGTYISELVLEYLIHEVENTAQMWDFANELDNLKLEDLPRSRFAITPAAAKIYSGTLLHANGRLESELSRRLGPKDGYFYLGDIFFLAKELNEATPKTALVIATPACDLVRPEKLRERTIFLCEGKVEKVTPSSVPSGQDGIPAVILAHPKDATKQLLISWKKKKLHTWHVEEMDKFRDPSTSEWVRVGRLRPLYALQLQHAITADLSRVGVQRAPNMLVPYGIECLVKKNGKWIQIDKEDVADAAASALSDSEDGKRTVYIIADPTVSRIRKKLLDWARRHLADVNADLASATEEVLNRISAVDTGVDAIVTSAPADVCTNVVSPHQSAQALSGGETVANNAVSSHVTKDSPAETAKILIKVIGHSDFEQRLMYMEHTIPVEAQPGKPVDICAYPMIGAEGLSAQEAESVVIVRPGKPTIYKNVGGGQTATPEQVASVVLKLMKV